MLHSLSAAVPRLALQSLLLAAAAAAAVCTGTGAASAGFAGSSDAGEPTGPLNVLGGQLQTCSTSPMTGFYRDGRCDTGPMDHGTNTVCAQVTTAFLEYTRAQGNDLMTPRPEYRQGARPGLRCRVCRLAVQGAAVRALSPASRRCSARAHAVAPVNAALSPAGSLA